MWRNAKRTEKTMNTVKKKTQKTIIAVNGCSPENTLDTVLSKSMLTTLKDCECFRCLV